MLFGKKEFDENEGYIETVYEGLKGQNLGFKDLRTGRTITTKNFIWEIENGEHPLYTVAKINGVKTPKTKPGVLPNLD